VAGHRQVVLEIPHGEHAHAQVSDVVVVRAAWHTHSFFSRGWLELNAKREAARSSRSPVISALATEARHLRVW
jgi:hypothetical protein